MYKTELERVEASRRKQQQAFDDSIRSMKENQQEIVSGLERQNEKTLNEVKTQNERRIEDYSDQVKNVELETQEKIRKKNEEVAERDNFNRHTQDRELRHVEKDYESSLEHLKQNADQNEHQIYRKNNEILNKQNDHFTDTIRELNTQHGEDIRKIQTDLNAEINKLKSDERKEMDDSSEKLGQAMREAGHQKEAALAHQSKIFGEALNRQRQGDQEDIELLEKALKSKPDSRGSNLIPPAVEDSIRKAVIDEYEKTFNIEREHHAEQTDGIKRKYTDLQKKMIEEGDDKIAVLERKSALKQSQDRSEYMNSMNDLRYTSNDEIRSKDWTNEREKDGMLRDYTLALQRQKREYDYILENTHADSAARLAEVRQDSSNEISNLHRELQSRQNEIIREYDTKLLTQREDYEAQIDQLKETSSLEIRNLQRKSKQELEAQSKVNQQRLDQLQAQSKERERNLSQNFQDLLDKTRRNYELSNKKKS